MSDKPPKSDGGSNDPFAADQTFFTATSIQLDEYHHDLPERHRFGLAFLPPVDPQPVGSVAFAGISDTPAREDHVHVGSGGGGAGAVPATTVTTSAVADASVVGVGTNYAREDHKHGREAFAAPTAETTFGTSSGAGAATTLPRSDHTHGNPVHDNAAHSAVALSALAVPTAAVNMNGQLVTNVATPVSGTDAANKNYVDNSITGLSWKQAVYCATTGNVGLSGTASVNVDGATLAVGTPVLVKSQTTTSQNGIYLAATGAWTRRSDSDSAAEIPSAAVWVEVGALYADTAWVCTTDPSGFVLDTSAVAYAQFAGPGNITAGAGMTQVGNTLNVIAGDTSVIVNADELHVNTAVMATVASLATYGKKFAAALTGTASPETVTHNLNTRDIQLTVLNGATPFTAVEVDWDATTVNTAVIRYNPNLGAGYRVVVVG